MRGEGCDEAKRDQPTDQRKDAMRRLRLAEGVENYVCFPLRAADGIATMPANSEAVHIAGCRDSLQLSCKLARQWQPNSMKINKLHLLARSLRNLG